MTEKSGVVKRLYNIHEAAESLGLSTRSIRELVDRKLLKPHRVLRKFLFPAAELDRFVADRQA